MRLEQLIVAKAISLGYQISSGKYFDQAIDLIDMSLRNKARERLNPEVIAFYLMVRDEAFRFRKISNYAENRSEIKQLCEQSRIPNLFELYIEIIGKTTAAHNVVGGGALSSLKKERATFGTDQHYDDHGDGFILSQNDDVVKILEWMGHTRGRNISEADRNFLYETNLSTLINKHFK